MYLWLGEFDGDLLAEERRGGGYVGGIDGVLDDGEVEVGDGPRHARLRDRQVVKVACKPLQSLIKQFEQTM